MKYYQKKRYSDEKQRSINKGYLKSDIQWHRRWLKKMAGKRSPNNPKVLSHQRRLKEKEAKLASLQ